MKVMVDCLNEYCGRWRIDNNSGKSGVLVNTINESVTTELDSIGLPIKEHY
eukprot:Awhi_evm1s1131